MADESPEWTIEVNLPNVPEGAKVEVYGLGSYENGGTYGIPNEVVERYRVENPSDEADPMKYVNPHEGIRIYPSAGGAPSKPDTEDNSPVGSEGEEGAQ
jgi:hypothetical protein